MPTPRLFEIGNISTQGSSSVLPNRPGGLGLHTGGTGNGMSPMRRALVEYPSSAGEEIIIDSPEGVSEILEARSLNNNRPEILVTTQFLPAHTDSNKTDRLIPGLMLDLQFDLRSLMIDDTETIIDSLKNDPVIQTELIRLGQNYDELLETIKDRLKLLSDILSNLNEVKRALDLKDNDSNIQVEIKKLRSSRGRRRSRRGGRSSEVATTPPLGQYSTLKQILSCQLQFSDLAYDSFSNSKIYGQLLSDLKNTINTYSPQLLATYSQNRDEDRDPVSIDTETVQDDTFTFAAKDISSQSNTALVGRRAATQTDLFEPTSYTSYKDFIDTLPTTEVDKIKLLTAILSKELRMSSGIARMLDTTYDTRFSPTFSGGVINRIVGDVGEQIIGDSPEGGSLASLLRFKDESGTTILPFERRAVIEPETGTTNVPGSVFLVDTIVENDNRPDTSSLSDYKTTLTDIVDNNTKALGYLLNFDDTLERLHFESVIEEIYRDISEILDVAGNKRTRNRRRGLAGSFNASANISLALINAAKSNTELRHALYKYTRELRSGSITVATTSLPSEDDTGTPATGNSPTSRTSPGSTGGTSSTSGGGTRESETSELGRHAEAAERLNSNRPMSGLRELNRTPDRSGGRGGRGSGRDPRENSTGVNPQNVGGSPPRSQVQADVLNDKVVSVMIETTLPRKIEQIINRTFRGSGTRFIPPLQNNNFFEVGNGQIESILNNGVSDTNLIFNRIAALADKFDRDAIFLSSLAPAGTTTSTGHKTENGLTRFNRYSDDTILMLVFEIVSCIINEVVSVNFSSTVINNDTLQVTSKEDQNASMSSQMKFLIGKIPEANIDTTYTIEASILESIHSRLIREDAIMRDIIDAIKGISATITSAVNSAVNFFGSGNNRELDNFIRDPDNADILKSLTDTQVALSWQGTREIFTSGDRSLIPNDQIITQNQMRALNSMLREGQFGFGSAKNLKIMSVGLPAGMLEALQNPPFVIGEDDSLETEVIDLVTLKIYRRDPEFYDIIFKPQTYLFDLSRFADLNGEIPEERVFDEILNQNVLLTDITGEDGIGVSDSLSDFKAQSEYNLLTDDQKAEVFRNHTVDRMLRLYVKLLTGMNLSEFTFIANEELLLTREVDPEVKSILERIAQTINNPTGSAIAGALARGASLSNVLRTPVVSNGPVTLMIGSASTSGGASRPGNASTSGGASRPGGGRERVGGNGYSVEVPRSPAGSGPKPGTTNSSVSGRSASEPLSRNTRDVLGTNPNRPRYNSGAANDSQSSIEEEGQSSTQNLADPIIEAQFKRLLNSLLFRASEQKIRVERPNLFERIFSIPVDPDDFEVDIEATERTEKGRTALNSLSFQTCVTDVTDETGVRTMKLIPRPPSEGNYEFSELFAVVALGVDET